MSILAASMESRNNKFENTTDLVIDGGVSNVIRKFGHDADILFVSCIILSLDAVQRHLKFAFDLSEGTMEESVQDGTRGDRSNRRE